VTVDIQPIKLTVQEINPRAKGNIHKHTHILTSPLNVLLISTY